MSAAEAPSERQQIEQLIAALIAQKWPDRRDAILDAAIDDEVARLRARLRAVEQIERDIRSVTIQNRFNPDKVLDAHIAKLRARLRQLDAEGSP